MSKVNKLLNIIKEFPGRKIITLSVVEDPIFECEMKNDKFTDSSVVASFVAKLTRGIADRGGMSIKEISDDNKIIHIFALGDDDWFYVGRGNKKKEKLN